MCLNIWRSLTEDQRKDMVYDIDQYFFGREVVESEDVSAIIHAIDGGTF